MAESKIEWTDATWNPVSGCDRVSPGCAYCYALTLAARLKRMGQPGYQRDGDPRTSGPGFGVSLHPAKLEEPLRWRKPRRVFVNSMSDLFHQEIPDEYIARVFGVMNEARQHTFQVLTKRPERARDWFASSSTHLGKLVDPLPNVWLGVSIENARYTWRADLLRQIPAAVRFISAEPLLGSLYPKGDTDAHVIARPALLQGRTRPQADAAVPPASPDLRAALHAAAASPDQVERPARAPLDLTGIDWVIIGGESGAKARPFHLSHAREILDACYAESDREGDSLRPAVFVKQLGAKPLSFGEGWLVLRDRKGGDWDEWPADLRIREFPRSAGC